MHSVIGAAFGAAQFITVICGFLTIVMGVGALHVTRVAGPHDHGLQVREYNRRVCLRVQTCMW